MVRVACPASSVLREFAVEGVDWDIGAEENIMRGSKGESDKPWRNELECAIPA